MGQLYLLLGDRFLVDKKLAEIRQDVGVDEYNSVVYDAEDFDLTTIVADAQTIPFMSDEKLVVIKHISFEASDLLGDFLALIDDIPSFLHLVIIPSKIDKKTKVFKRISSMGEVHDYEKLSNEQLRESMVHFLDRRMIKIEPQALDELVARVDMNAESVMHELSKMDNYFAQGDTVTLYDVEMLTPRNVEDDVFQLINAVVAKQKQPALAMLSDLLKSEDAMRLLTLIQNKFREINYTKQLLMKGFKKEDLMRLFNASKGRAYYMEKNASSLSEDELRYQLDQLADTEFSIKKGILDKQVALELYILNL